MSVFTTLPQRLALLFDEPAVYFASRLAAHHFRPARMFTMDMGMNLQRLADGCKATIAKLAELSGVPFTELMRSSLRKQDAVISLKGQTLRKIDLRRNRTHVCPACLKDDIASSNLPVGLAIHGRANWMLQAIRSCPVHNLAMIEVARDVPVQDTHDWTLNMTPVLPRITELANTAIHRPPSSLETYLLNRLEGASAGIWLDRLEFYAAAHVSELFGAVATFGKRVNLRMLGEDDKYRAGDAGFPIVAHGATGLQDFMRLLKSEHVSKNVASADGPQAVYGKIYMSLSQGLQNSAFDPVRGIMAEHILDNFALGPGDEVFGKAVLQRRFHSVRSASVAFGMHPKRLRKLVISEGLVSDASQPDSSVLFDAAAAERIFERERNSVSVKRAEQYLNAGRVQTRVLLDAGLLQRHRVGIGGMNDVLFAEELDEFLATLLLDAKSMQNPGDGMVDISAAAKRACCSTVEVVKLVLDRKLRNVGKLESTFGFASVLVNLDEIKSMVKLDTPDGLPPDAVARTILKTNVTVMAQLIKCGAIRTTLSVNPINRCPTKIIPFSEIARFQRQFVSLYHFARDRALHMPIAKKQLGVQGVEPAAGFDGVKATFYRRADLAAIGMDQSPID